MKESDDEKYLGDIISYNGKNTKNIKARVDKGIGNVKQIMSILQEVCFGKFQFEVAIILRNSLLLSSMLTNAETWVDVKKSEIVELEQVDENLLRSVLEAPSSTPKEMLYLELGIVPIRFIMMSRRLSFLHYIMNQKEDSLLYNFFQAQLKHPVKKDWCETIKEDLDYLSIKVKIEELKNISKNQFKHIVKKAVDVKAFEYLKAEKGKHSKVKDTKHDKLEMQDYLSPNTLSNLEAKFIFLLRTRMLEVKANFKNKHADLLCVACNVCEETQEHILSCNELKSRTNVVQDMPHYYSDLFGNDLDKKILVSKLIKENFTTKKKLEKEPQS